MKLLTNLDLSRNEIKNVVIHNLPSHPSEQKEGQVYFNTSQNQHYAYSNGKWTVLGSDSIADIIGLQEALDSKGSIDNEHNHKNKADLDSITDTRLSNWDIAYRDNHIHEHKAILDGIDEDTKLVCMVGRFSEAKDQPTLIKAISKLADDVNLILVGEGPLMDNNKELVNQLGISNRVHFLGFRQDVFRILKTVDIVVLSSHWEGFGLGAVEGMAAGKPVIVSDVGGLSEIVKEAGFVFKNEKELKNILNSLLTDHVLYKKTAEKCNCKAEKFDIKKMLTTLRNIYF